MSLAADGVLCIFGSFNDSELYSRNNELVTAVSECYQQSYRIGSASTDLDTKEKPQTFLNRVVLFAFKSLNEFFGLARQRGQLGKASAYFVPYPAYINLFFLLLLIGLLEKFLCL